MIRNFSLFVLVFALSIVASAASITETTLLYEKWGGTSDCSYIGNFGFTTCSNSSQWSNGSRTTTVWSDIGASWLSAGKSVGDSYNWGTAEGASWFTADAGAGWNTSDNWNQYLGSWSGATLNSDGYGNSWTGNDNQVNHTIWNSIYNWSCDAQGRCTQDSYWWTTNQYDYLASGTSASTLFGQQYSSDGWQNAFSNSTGDHGHDVNTWNRFGETTSNTPEPGTSAMFIGAGMLGAVWMLKRRLRPRIRDNAR